MNLCLILVIVTTVVTTAAQDIPVIFTSAELTEPDPDYKLDKDDIFKEEQLINYSPSGSTPGAQNLPDYKWLHSARAAMNAMNGDEENVIENSKFVSTDAQDLPGIFGDDEEHVIEYSTIGSAQSDEVQNSIPVSITTTFNEIPIPKTNLSVQISFDDWDMINEDETTLFEVYNQTILNDMKKQETGALPPVPTLVPPRYTTPPLTFDLDMSLFNIPSTTPAPPKPTTATPSPKTTTPITYELPFDILPIEETENTISGNTITTQLPVNSEEVTVESRHRGDSEEYPDPVTEDPGFDEEEARNDPCNYEKQYHSLPEIKKTGRRVSEIKCEEYMWHYKINVLDVETKRKECAEQMARKNEHVTEVVGGVKAVEGDFPHMGAVGWIRLDDSLRWMCGSSLISPRFTLTAAHCRNATAKLGLKYTEPRVVRFGSVFLENGDEVTKNLRGHDVLIAEFLVLEAYAKEPIKKYNDVGLIRLREEVHMTLLIKPACLWTGYLGNILEANITGWGTTTNEGSESNYLRYAEVDFIDKSTCKKYIHGRRNRHWPQGLKDHQFCAGKLSGGIDACQGDSGGPLQFREPMPAAMNSTDVVHRVVGITNFGVKCAYPFLPGVYTNVTSFICWIEKNVWPEENNAFCP